MSSRKGSSSHPDYAPLYGIAGIRYIISAGFDQAVRNLERRRGSDRCKPDVVESRRSTKHPQRAADEFGLHVWYHLGVVRFLKGDDAAAVRALRQAMKFTRG